MNYESIKKWRLIIPGIIIFVLISLHTTNSFDDLKSLYGVVESPTFNSSLYLAISILLGVFYYVFNLGNLIIFKPIDNMIIRKNIITRIKSFYSKEIEDTAISDDKVMNVFWRIVDDPNYKTLEKRKSRILLNGLIWSSLTDFAAISALCSISFLIRYFISKNIYFKSMFLYLLILVIVCLILVILIVKKHKKLSNYQLDFIKEHCRQKVDEYIDVVIS